MAPSHTFYAFPRSVFRVVTCIPVTAGGAKLPALVLHGLPGKGITTFSPSPPLVARCGGNFFFWQHSNVMPPHSQPSCLVQFLILDFGVSFSYQGSFTLLLTRCWASRNCSTVSLGLRFLVFPLLLLGTSFKFPLLVRPKACKRVVSTFPQRQLRSRVFLTFPHFVTFWIWQFPPSLRLPHCRTLKDVDFLISFVFPSSASFFGDDFSLNSCFFFLGLLDPKFVPDFAFTLLLFKLEPLLF